MKLLLDACVWGGAFDVLRRAGHDVMRTTEWGPDPGDEEILRRAYQDRRVLVTVDKDFGELAVVRGMPHAGIARLVDVPARQQGETCVGVLEQYGDELQRGALVTIERGRIRIRSPES